MIRSESCSCVTWISPSKSAAFVLDVLSLCLSTITGPAGLLVLVIAAVVQSVVRFQKFKHCQYGGLKSSAKVTAAVGFIKWRHVDESAASVPKMQRGVIGVITQIPAKEQG